MTAVARPNRIWQCNAISFASKFKLYKSLVTSILLYGCETRTLLVTLRKESRLRKPSAWGNFSVSPTWSTRSTTGCGASSNSLWVIFWQLSKDGKVHDSGNSHATTASPKPSFKAPWRVGVTIVSRGNAGRTTSKSGHPCLCQNCLQGTPAEKTRRESLLNRPSCPPDDPIVQRTELNWRCA